MSHIGIKIKELRKKKDMTQEKLAEYLNVSFQAVSKWETGAASPDLSLVVPLTRLLEVSADELFGLADPAEDRRQRELHKEWEQTWETGDTEKRYAVARAAAAEYPGNFRYLGWLADAESDYAVHNCPRGSAEQRMHFEQAVRYYEMIIEDCGDSDARNDALYGIVLNLPNIGRREEAVQYAKQHPRADELLKWCLTGEEREKHRQNVIFDKLNSLIFELEFGHRDLPAIQAAEAIIKAVVDDGNYLWFHNALMHNYIWQAQCLTRDNRPDEAIRLLRKSHDHAVQFERMYAKGKEAPLPYTCAVFSRLSHDSNAVEWSGTTTLTQDFREYLSWKDFDALREREDFRALFSL